MDRHFTTVCAEEPSCDVIKLILMRVILILLHAPNQEKADYIRVIFTSIIVIYKRNKADIIKPVYKHGYY